MDREMQALKERVAALEQQMQELMKRSQPAEKTHLPRYEHVQTEELDGSKGF